MVDEIEIPRSFRFWLVSENAVALETLADQERLPPSLKGEEVWEFYKAQFAYTVTIHDFYDMLMQIWKATWGVAITKNENCFSSAPVSAYADDTYSPEDWLSPEKVWEFKEFYGIAKPSQSKNGRTLATFADFDEADKNISLGFFIFSKNVQPSHTDDVIIKGGEWQEKCILSDESGEYPYRATAFTVPIDRDTMKIDIAGLRNAAITAIDDMTDQSSIF